jgi:hypothetical protein
MTAAKTYRPCDILDAEPTSHDGYHPKRSRFLHLLSGIFAALVPSPSSFVLCLAKKPFDRPFAAPKAATESRGLMEFQPEISQYSGHYFFGVKRGY